MNVIVTFNDPTEFIKELANSLIFEDTVRLTGSYRTKGAYPLSDLYLLGTYIEVLQGGLVPYMKLVKLECYCGQVMHQEKDSKAQQLYTSKLAHLEKEIATLRLQIRPGVYHFPNDDQAS